MSLIAGSDIFLFQVKTSLNHISSLKQHYQNIKIFKKFLPDSIYLETPHQKTPYNRDVCAFSKTRIIKNKQALSFGAEAAVQFFYYLL